jgi:hypothetical protein
MPTFQIETEESTRFPKGIVIAVLRSKTKIGALREWKRYKRDNAGYYVGPVSLKKVTTIARAR